MKEVGENMEKEISFWISLQPDLEKPLKDRVDVQH